ncbi:hypothetical protein [Streptomyces sp. HM190]|uniref:hypothetical protein n=1 Tax=Streptomyces sp. HM190 TaxID=2695266 RepID=UPI0013596331|nr:hypothetical protein [Streptomyces sp. HM190]
MIMNGSVAVWWCESALLGNPSMMRSAGHERTRIPRDGRTPRDGATPRDLGTARPLRRAIATASLDRHGTG